MSAPTKGLFPLIRYFSAFVTPYLLRTPLSANQVTTLSLVVGLVCAWCVMEGSYLFGVVGGVFLVFNYILDNCDGDIARAKDQCSSFGMHYDTFVDWAVHTAFFAALGIGVGAASAEDIWVWLGWIAAGGGTVNYALGFILDANGDGSPQESTHAKKPETALEWTLFIFRELSRADFCFIVLALALFGVVWVLLPMGAIGAQVYWAAQFFKGARDYHV
jgi:phosphatidylglycerophosphate synthase